jgi:putative two-component system response regulator
MSELPAATVLVVDDSPENIYVLSEILRPTYRVLAATDGATAIEIAKGTVKPDLILLDVMMPNMDGYEVLERIRRDSRTAGIPVVFLTALADSKHEEIGLSKGANDYIAKPFTPIVVVARVRTQLEAKQTRDWLTDRNAALEAEVARRMRENDLTQQVSIRALAHLAEARDPETGNHILRTQGYVRRMAQGLQSYPRFKEKLTDRYVELLARSAPLHDIGKVAIPDHILLKPGKLTADEWVVMKTHAKLGSDAIEQAERDIDTPFEFLAAAKEIAHWHHEKMGWLGLPGWACGRRHSHRRTADGHCRRI